MSMYVGEALVGEGNEVSHIDLLIGDKDGPVGVAFRETPNWSASCRHDGSGTSGGIAFAEMAALTSSQI